MRRDSESCYSREGWTGIRNDGHESAEDAQRSLRRSTSGREGVHPACLTYAVQSLSDRLKLMRILLAGGVYRLTPEARARKRPAPEEVLEVGLRAAGEDVDVISLKDFKAGVSPSCYDIVHVHHMSKMAVMQALLPRPMVFTPHSSTYGTTVARRSAERIVWNRSDGIVCLSEMEKRDKISRLPSLADKIAV